MRRFHSEERKEKGSLTVETLLFLIPFMFAFLTLINAARFVQAEMLLHHAITQTAKQVSTYSYILTKTDITDMVQQTHEKSEKFRTDTEKTVNSVAEFAGAVGGLGSSDNLLAEVDDAIQKGKTAHDTVEDYLSDPEEIMNGALAMVKSKGEDAVTTWAIGAMTRGNIKKSLEKVKDDPDGYLKTIGIVDGMSGLNFSRSEWLTDYSKGKGNVDIVVTYRLKNLLFPDFDFGEHEFCQCASTLIW